MGLENQSWTTFSFVCLCRMDYLQCRGFSIPRLCRNGELLNKVVYDIKEEIFITSMFLSNTLNFFSADYSGPNVNFPPNLC